MASTEDDDGEISRMLSFIPELRSVFDVKEKVGEGTFSKVYRALVKTDAETSTKEYALKYLVPTSRPSRIASELQCLKEVGGSCNIVGIELCLMHQGHVVIVMPYFAHQRFVDYLKVLTVNEIREYMKNLFFALHKIHSHGIIHRDVKPNNFLCDRFKKRYALVDFGLAQRTHASLRRSEMSTAPPQPFKEHNPLPAQNKLIRSDASRSVDYRAKDKLVPTSRRPPPQSLTQFPQKRPLDFSQENNSNSSKKRALDLRLNDSSVPVSSKINFLPTPPHTPSSRCSQKAVTKNTAKPPYEKQCACFGKNVVCKVCLGRVPEEAPRGGTPGFRAPEVLLKCREQSTALDMWSAGVILLSMLSRKYPFFRAEDDLSSLAEIVFLVGIDEMKAAAAAIGKSLVLNLPGFMEITKMRQQLSPSRYLQTLCMMFRCEDLPASQPDNSGSDNSNSKLVQTPLDAPDSAYDLLSKLLDPNPLTRISADAALAHPFISTLL